MVVFTCNHCSDSLQKPKVEKHITIECRKKFMNPSLCCVDCLKDFNGQTYSQHTKCVTELERYSGKGFVPKPSSNKGERKQESWVEVIQAVLKQPKLSGPHRNLLKTLANYPNVPRKQQKFKNFIQSSLRHLKSGPNVIDEVFNLIETEFKSQQVNTSDNKEIKKDTPNEEATGEKAQNGQTPEETQPENETKKSKNKKNKPNDSVNTDTPDEPLPETSNPLDESVAFEPVKKKKKSKKKENVATENDNNEIEKPEIKEKLNENGKRSFGNNFEEDIPSKDISKKKQKKMKLQELQEPSLDESATVEEPQAAATATEPEVNGAVEEPVKENGELPVDEENLQNLSRKERKALRKKLKYEAELKALESEVKNPESEKLSDNQENTNQKDDSEESPKKGKKKKRKLTENDENQEVVAKKSKILESEPMNAEIEQVNGGDKFSWEEVVRKVLEKAEGNEISVKKLTKKAIAEYQACHSDQKTYEDILKKFNKKITKLPFVKILKDKAKLCA